MAETLESLQSRLRTEPNNWELRLQIADTLLGQGEVESAGVLISMAPNEPEEADHCSRASAHLLRLSPDRALRQAQRALAANEMDARATLVCAEAHRHKNQPAEAEKHYLIACQLDPEMAAQATDLKVWLDQNAGAASEEDAAPVVLQVLDRSNGDSNEVQAIPAPTPDVEAATVVPESDDGEFVSEEGIHFHVSSDPHMNAKPSQLRLLKAKLAAAGVGILVHVLLVLMLGVLVIVMPSQPSAEITAMTNVDDSQEKPETKKIVVPQPTPATAAVARPTTSAITATGISAVSLPEFDFQAPAEAVSEVATTDLGSTFAPAFATKGMAEVNFFGIKSKGKRIAFLIEAERLMLTDPKGGIPAYEIVKEEIANMISKFGVQTRFNVVLFEGTHLSAFSDKPVPGTSANMAGIRDWLYPVNREYEKIGLRAINYPRLNPVREIEPIPTNKLSGYMLAIQYALESECDTVFIMTSGWRHMRKYDTPEEMEKYYRQVRWTDRDEKKWQEALLEAREWLKKENETRKEKGIPQRVIRGWHEIVAEILPQVRRKPGPDISADEREDQINNAMRVIYSSQKKPKPQINFVMFIGKDERTVPRQEHFENISRRARNGKVLILPGLEALKNVTGRG
jgi:hypothetical protein